MSAHRAAGPLVRRTRVHTLVVMTGLSDTTQTLDTDLLVIGWGKAGKTLARDLGSRGRRVVLVERDDAFIGGSCINVACVPTKDLIDSAEHRAGAEPAAYLRQAIASRDSLVTRLRAANRAMLETVEAVTLISGEAWFIGPRRVRVRGGDETLEITADQIVINTGSSPLLPDLPGIDGPTVHTSQSIQHIAALPERFAIIGGGFIAMEFASMFAAFGSRVTVLERSAQFGAGLDDDVREAVVATLTDRGVRILTGAAVESIDPTGVDTAVGRVDAEAVLVATGRKPETAALNLGAAGVATDERGFIVVDERLATSAPGVWAAGDVNGGPQFTYISLDDYRILASQLAGDGSRTTADRSAVPNTVFITPPLAQVGLSEREARRRGIAHLVAFKNVADIAAMPRPKILGETHGLIKVLVDPDTDLLLGATIFCTDAQEVINLVALAMRAGVTATQLRDGIWTHPSSTEALNEVLAVLRRR
ncbi:Pyridine nucleotide disulphide reductase class-I signature [Propionibacterium australiense]|uniref:Pyridine nucleotide disulphide reductase class-I signature n=2 Tax=Propionibacterium australiense TaxID=119981 RepID=A0A383S9P9_9ACTN|nr:Pyridine nucleotide disulphide reductase class-I signature [Propionibacterium australiense]